MGFCLGYPVGDAVLGVHVPVVGGWRVVVFCHRVLAEGVWKELERRVYVIRRAGTRAETQERGLMGRQRLEWRDDER